MTGCAPASTGTWRPPTPDAFRVAPRPDARLRRRPRPAWPAPPSSGTDARPWPRGGAHPPPAGPLSHPQWSRTAAASSGCYSGPAPQADPSAPQAPLHAHAPAFESPGSAEAGWGGPHPGPAQQANPFSPPSTRARARAYTQSNTSAWHDPTPAHALGFAGRRRRRRASAAPRPCGERAAPSLRRSP